MKKISTISEFKANDDIQGFYLCKEKNLRTTRAGELFLDLMLKDKTGEVGAKVWDRVKEFEAKFEAGDAVAVRGRVDMFQDRLQVVVGRINKATPEKYGRHGFKEDDLVPTSPYDPVKMWTEVGALIQKIKNNYLKKLLTDIYKSNKKTLQRIPASIAMHYPYRSGYLEHVLSMAKVGLKLARHYQADEDLVLAGILLHSVGKVREFTDALVPEYTDEGNFLGHTDIGRDMTREAAARINDFPPDLLLQLEHMVSSHEGVFDGRRSSRARTKEALLLQLIDYMDTRLNVFDKVIQQDSEYGEWTSRRNFFGASLYKGKSTADS
jgi:3'-5' exoribonuclease